MYAIYNRFFMHEPLNVKELDQARSEFSEHWKPAPRVEIISIDEAWGRILAEDAASNVDLPPFSRSAYDGFAVRAEDTFGAEEDDPNELELKGEVHAGDRPDLTVDEGTCAEISTGAVVPEGADAVVMVENASRRNEKVEVREAISPGENISERGSEIAKGDVIAEAGQRISPQVHGALYAAGVREIQAYRSPEVGIISSGEELVKVDEELEDGQIYDVNGPAVCDAVKASGGAPDYLGIVADDMAEIKDKIKKALSDYDVVITSGGSSAGSKDILPQAINALGEPGVVVHGLAQKPGKPTVLSVIDGKPLFGLPGYPVSALMVFDQAVAPYIRKMAGISNPSRATLQASLTRKVLPARGRRELLPVGVFRDGEETFAEPLREGSGAITSLANADGYVDVPLGREILDKGQEVTVKLFGEGELA